MKNNIKNFDKERKLAHKLNTPDFYRALRERNFDDMSDIYNEMTKYDGRKAREGENTCFFTEVLEGYKIKFPITAAGIIRSFGQDFYYALKDDSIGYVLNESLDEDIFFEDLNKENLEADRVKLTGDTITCTAKAVKTLELAVGDIIEIVICNEAFYIKKCDNQLLRMYCEIERN